MADTSEMLRKIKEGERRNEKKADPEGFYPKLIILKLRRRQLALALMLAFAAFVAILARDHNHPEKPWWLAGLPIAALGLIIGLIPPSEEWEYKPWQARPRQYERHQIER